MVSLCQALSDVVGVVVGQHSKGRVDACEPLLVTHVWQFHVHAIVHAPERLRGYVDSVRLNECPKKLRALPCRHYMSLALIDVKMQLVMQKVGNKRYGFPETFARWVNEVEIIDITTIVYEQQHALDVLVEDIKQYVAE